MKKLLIISSLLVCNYSYASINIELENSTNETIFYSSKKTEVTNSKESAYKNNLLEPTEIVELPKTNKFIFNNYIIEIKDSFVSCAWINILGHKKEQGRGINIFINYQLIGTICANKTNILTTKPKAKISIYKDFANNINFRFVNTGWWPEDNVFPSDININLTYAVLSLGGDH